MGLNPRPSHANIRLIKFPNKISPNKITEELACVFKSTV